MTENNTSEIKVSGMTVSSLKSNQDSDIALMGILLDQIFDAKSFLTMPAEITKALGFAPNPSKVSNSSENILTVMDRLVTRFNPTKKVVALQPFQKKLQDFSLEEIKVACEKLAQIKTLIDELNTFATGEIPTTAKVEKVRKIDNEAALKIGFELAESPAETTTESPAESSEPAPASEPEVSEPEEKKSKK